MDVRPIEPSFLDRARRLLRAEELPTEDLDDSVELFGAYEADQLVGVVGLQRCGDLGLLRSLAVVSQRRGRGVARALCERVFVRARERALDSIWLLTTSARDYFARHGFDVVDRAQVPESIRATAQFASLCPASASVMRSNRFT